MRPVKLIGNSESVAGLMFTPVIFIIGNNSSKEFKPVASKLFIRIITLKLFEFEIVSSEISAFFISISTSSKFV